MNRIYLFGATSMLLFLVACGPNLRDFKEVEAEFAEPTGVLTEGNVGRVFGMGSDANTTGGVSTIGAAEFDTTGTLDFALSQLEGTLGSRQDRLLVEGCATNLKINREMGPEKITVDCTDNADPTGKLVLEFVYRDSDVVAIYVRFQDWCDQGNCIDGWFGWTSEVDAAAVTGVVETNMLVAKLAFTPSGGSVREAEWAVKTIVTETTAEFELLIYATAEGVTGSFVLTASVSEAGGDLSIRASDGEGGTVEWTCTYTADGDSGSCSHTGGTTSLTWETTG